MGMKAFQSTRRTKVFADGMVRKIIMWPMEILYCPWNGKLFYKDETEMNNEAVQEVGELNSTLTIEK